VIVLGSQLRRASRSLFECSQLTYNFKVVVGPDEDFDATPLGWHAYCPAFEKRSSQVGRHAR
jgi:hypothetical protein